MLTTVKRIVGLGIAALLLGACAAAENEEAAQEIVEEAEAVEEAQSSPLPEIPTTYPANVTALRQLTDEDLQLRKQLMVIVEEHAASDRDAIYRVAPEYGREPEELWQTWLAINESFMHGGGASNYAVLPSDRMALQRKIIEALFPDSDIEFMGSRSTQSETRLGYRETVQLTVNGIYREVALGLKINEKTETAELIQLTIDGEEYRL